MSQEWKEISDGQIEVRIYPGGVAGDDQDMVRKMRIGQLQGAALTGQGLATISQDQTIFQMPMLLRSDEELDYVRGKLSKKMEMDLEEKGFKVLYWSEVGWVYLFSNQPVAEPSDLRPLKIWVWAGDASWANALKDAGYKPVPLPATEIHTALSSGLVDAFSTTPVAALSYQWFGQAKNMMAMKWAPLTAAVVISVKSWQKIPDDIRPSILKAAVKAGESAKNQIRKLEDDAIQTMQNLGLKVNNVNASQQVLWVNEIKETYPKLVGASIPEEIYNEVNTLLKNYRR